MKHPPFSSKSFGHGRLGKLELKSHKSPLQTPLLFPVAAMVTSTTARGGGIWKYVLQADEENGLLRRNLPVLTQVLHFLDFSSTIPPVLNEWRKIGITRRYNQDIPNLNYSAPLFLDSGGFKLLWNNNLDLSKFGLSLQGKEAAQSILELQRDFGGDIVASLDYPLPPGLEISEINSRVKKSQENALKAAQQIQSLRGKKPLLYVAVHGQDRECIKAYVQKIFKKFKATGLTDFPIGLAVGSLVPLRGAQKNLVIVDILRGVKEGIPEEFSDSTPIHVFGVTGNLIPILCYLGMDSFDSSTYIQEAKSLGYFVPSICKYRPILEMDKLGCNCRICRKVDLRILQDSLVSNIKNRPQASGHYKSKYYGDIALHNLEMDFQIVETSRQLIADQSLSDYLVQHVETYPALRPVIELFATQDEKIKIPLTRKSIVFPQLNSEVKPHQRSYKFTPKDFDILENGYAPPSKKAILLVIPCSGEKPYSTSRTHRLISERLSEGLSDEKIKLIHKVTLSGLYGPVPEEHENEKPILSYEFRLDPNDEKQIALVTERLIDYLKRHQSQYQAFFAYATSLSYRTVLERAAKEVSGLQVLPGKPKSRRLTEFFRKENVSELINQIRLTQC